MKNSTTKRNTKKKTVEEKNTVNKKSIETKHIVEGPVFVDGTMHLSPNDLVRYDLYRTRIDHALQQITINRNDAESIKRRAEEDIRRLQALNHQIMADAKLKEEDFNSFRDAISKAYGVDMMTVSYDDKSGKLYFKDQSITAPSVVK